MIKVGDVVKVITGEHKGKDGKVTKVLSSGKVIIEGINIIKKHVKPNAKNETGGILDIEAPIHVSNVKLIDKKEAKKESKKEEKTSKPKTTKKESKK
jgi:large subunit ribosomal protein L24